MNPIALARFALAIAPDVKQLVRAFFEMHKGDANAARTTIRRIKSYALEMQHERTLTDQAIAAALKREQEASE
jgi:hypothetical protein